jgi:hypothetical protein
MLWRDDAGAAPWQLKPHDKQSDWQLFTMPPQLQKTGLDVRLQQWAAGTAVGMQERQQQQQQHQQQRVVLLDPPAAVRRLQDRQDMLQPLAGQPLILTHNSQQVGVEGVGVDMCA